ncbi:MAG: type 4a pilus biogenesis protein PilO [Planctomycetes bacterium]|nr:type 4a pilus biogenesis protein PilO [Planctomycetota bacterium]
MKLTEKQLLILTIVIPAVVAIGLAGVGFFVFSKDIAKLNKDIAEVNLRIKDEKDRLTKMVELEEKLKKLRLERDALQALLPTKEEASYENFIDTLTRFSREAGVKLSSATADEGRSGPPTTGSTSFDKMAYSLKIQGNFFQIINFVYLLETYQRFIKVDNFSVRPVGAVTADKPTQYNLDVKITSYVYKEPGKK